MSQSLDELLAAGVLGGQAGANATTQRDQFLAPKLLDETGIAGQYDAQQRLRVEARAGQQAQLAQGRRTHLLRLVDEQHAAPAGGVQVRQPAFAQGLEAAPSVVRAKRDGEDVAEFAVEVGQVAL